jgi:hypothetical protein
VAGAFTEASAAPPPIEPPLVPVAVPPLAGPPVVEECIPPQPVPAVHAAPSTQFTMGGLEAGQVLQWNVPSAPQLQQMAADPALGSLALSGLVVGPEPGSVAGG